MKLFNVKHRITFRNLRLALIDQLPWGRAWHNFVVTGNAWGLFHINSHIRGDNQQPKVMYNTRVSAVKSAEAMGKKQNTHFSPYKCAYCNGYHIGRNRENK